MYPGELRHVHSRAGATQRPVSKKDRGIAWHKDNAAPKAWRDQLGGPGGRVEGMTLPAGVSILGAPVGRPPRSEHPVQCGHDGVVVDGLRHVAGEPGLVSAPEVRLVDERRHRDDSQIGELRILPERRQEGESVHPRHPEVAKDQVGAQRAQEAKRLDAIARDEHLIAERAQELCEGVAAVLVVFDDEDCRGSLAGTLRSHRLNSVTSTDPLGQDDGGRYEPWAASMGPGPHAARA